MEYKISPESLKRINSFNVNSLQFNSYLIEKIHKNYIIFFLTGYKSIEKTTAVMFVFFKI